MYMNGRLERWKSIDGKDKREKGSQTLKAKHLTMSRLLVKIANFKNPSDKRASSRDLFVSPAKCNGSSKKSNSYINQKDNTKSKDEGNGVSG